jgi:thiol-disulfide isomerase/thioredoxin
MPHPRSFLLSAFADGALPHARRDRVAAHLAACARCRAAVESYRAIGSAAAALDPAPLPADGLAAVLARRAAGDRVILPVEDAPPRRAMHPALRAAAGIVLLLAAAAVLMVASAPRLEAVSSEMRLSPEGPRRGEAVRLVYAPGSGFAGAEALVVRARLRRHGDRAYEQRGDIEVLDTLRRGRDGVFGGQIHLPPSVVYAALTVETADGEEVDTNQRRYWEVLVHDSAGRPLADALHQRTEELTGRDWEGAFESARELVRLYPDDPESWSAIRFFETALRGSAAADSLQRIHLARFRQLDAALGTRPGVDGDDMTAMYFYALGVQDSAAAARWDARLAAEHPRHPGAVQNRAVQLMRAHYDQPAVLLAALDALWDQVGPAHSTLAVLGIQTARRTGDPRAIRRWATRYLHFYVDDVVSVADNSFTDHPSLRPDGLRVLRDELARLRAPDEAARFGVTRAEFQRRREARVARVLAALGRHLAEAGQTRAALDTFALATESVWDPDVFLLAGRARLETGDTAGGARMLSRVVVDPATPAARRDSVAALARAFPPAAWAARLDSARGEMRERVLAQAVSRGVPAGVRLVDGQGAAVSFADAAGEGPVVVVFWSRHCGPARQAIALLNSLAQSGVRVIGITDEAPSADFRDEARALGLRLPIYHDTRRQAAHSFHAWGTPYYFVLDADRRIRFEYTSPADIPRQVAVLSPTAGQRHAMPATADRVERVQRESAAVARTPFHGSGHGQVAAG